MIATENLAWNNECIFHARVSAVLYLHETCKDADVQ